MLHDMLRIRLTFARMNLGLCVQALSTGFAILDCFPTTNHHQSPTPFFGIPLLMTMVAAARKIDVQQLGNVHIRLARRD